MAQKLNPFSSRQFEDASGIPYSGAKLFIYEAGSATKATTTKDLAGLSAHANPIILNSRGEPGDGAGAAQTIWQAEGTTVKLVLAPSGDTDPPTSAISSWDNIAGINDTSVAAQDQWISGPTPTYVNATSFTLVGDQTSDFHVGRRLKTTNSGGTIYSTIITSAYTSLTTITVVSNSGSLDSGLSAASYGLITATNNSTPNFTYLDNLEGAAVASATTTEIWDRDGITRHITGTTTITSLGTANNAGEYRWLIFDGALTLTHGTNLNLPGGANISTEAGDFARVYADTTTQFDVQYFKKDGTPIAPLTTRGDIMKRDASSNGRLAIGSANKVLISDGTDPKWGDVVESSLTSITSGSSYRIAVLSTEQTSTSSGYVAATTEIVVPRAGTYQVVFDLKLTGTPGTANGRVYRNASTGYSGDAAYGAEQSHNTSSYATKTESLSLNAGDLLTLYFRVNSPATSVEIRSFRLESAVKQHG